MLHFRPILLRMTRSHRTRLILCGLCTLLAAPPALAKGERGDKGERADKADPQAPPSREESAKAHYQKGALLYKQGDYAGAWLEFTTAYQLIPRPELLFNMARCEVKLGRPAEALMHFRGYLEAIPGDPDADGIRKEMEVLQGEVERQRRREEQQAKEEAARRPPPPRPRRPWPVYGTVAGAGTLLLGVIGVSLLGAVNSQYRYLEGFCAPNCRPDEVGPLERQATAGYVFLGLTAAGAVTTAALLTWELRRRPSSERAALRIGGGVSTLGLGWRF